MAVFGFKAVATAGPIETGTIEAESQGDAVLLLQRRGLRLVSIERADESRPGRARKARPTGSADLAKAVSGLAVLIGAGLPLDRSLTIAIDNIEAPPLKRLFVDVQRRVKEGVPLSQAIAAEGAAFPAIMAPMVESGEADGRLGDSLVKLGQTLERGAKLRQTIVSAMIYPAILLVIATGVVLMMMLFVVPQFESLFTSNMAELPAMTRLVMGASRGLRANGLMLLLILVGIGFVVRAWLRRPAARRWLGAWLLSLPKLGTLLRQIESARFARVLGGLLASGVALPVALGLAQRTIGNSRMAEATGEIVARVREGAPLSPQIAATRLFPKVAVSFIRTGEETTTLPAMLERLADVLDDEVTVSLQRLITLITPLITIFMGVIVATLIGSIMSAILGFNSAALGS